MPARTPFPPCCRWAPIAVTERPATRMAADERLRMQITIALRSPTMTINSSWHRVTFGGATAFALAALAALFQPTLAAQQRNTSAPPTPYTQAFVRDPRIPIDQAYTDKIKEYTTEPFFSSPLVDYLPA